MGRRPRLLWRTRRLVRAPLTTRIPPKRADGLKELRDWFLQAIVYYTLGSYPYPNSYMTLGVKPLPHGLLLHQPSPQSFGKEHPIPSVLTHVAAR